MRRGTLQAPGSVAWSDICYSLTSTESRSLLDVSANILIRGGRSPRRSGSAGGGSAGASRHRDPHGRGDALFTPSGRSPSVISGVVRAHIGTITDRSLTESVKSRTSLVGMKAENALRLGKVGAIARQQRTWLLPSRRQATHCARASPAPGAAKRGKLARSGMDGCRECRWGDSNSAQPAQHGDVWCRPRPSMTPIRRLGPRMCRLSSGAGSRQRPRRSPSRR
jgi:hypothetical protein